MIERLFSTLMKRRQLLSVAGFGSGLIMTGCMQRTSGQTPTSQPDSEPTSTGETTKSRDLSESDELASNGNLRVKNTTRNNLCTRIIMKEGARKLLWGDYEISAERGILFPNIGKSETRYSITISLEDGTSEDFVWATKRCPEPVQVTDATINIRNSGIHFRREDCNEAVDTREFTYLVSPERSDCIKYY